MGGVCLTGSGMQTNVDLGRFSSLINGEEHVGLAVVPENSNVSLGKALTLLQLLEVQLDTLRMLKSLQAP